MNWRWDKGSPGLLAFGRPKGRTAAHPVDTMPILIDGWNFIRDRSSPIDDGRVDSLDAAMTLVSYLEDFQASHGDPITVVFDSKRQFLGIDRINTEKLKIVPACNADSYIKKYIEDFPQRQRRNLRVVSSDNEIYYFARSCGAAPVKSHEFWARLDRP